MNKKITFILIVAVVIALVCTGVYLGWKDEQACGITQNVQGYVYNGQTFSTYDEAVRACVPYAN